MTGNHLQNRGLTLVELMVTLAIAGILIASAAPSFTESIRNTRMVTQVNELHAALSLARSEAVKRNIGVTVCRSSNGTGCTGFWQDGWIIFVDSNADGIVNGEEIVRVHGALAGGNTLSTDQSRVTYVSSGRAATGSNSTFTLCDQRGATRAKGLVIGLSGRPSLLTSSDDLECPS